MADIAAGDVTYTVTKQRKEESGNKVNSVTITFGNSTLTYPSGGIPLTKASMGCPNVITAATLEAANSGDGIVYKYDKTNNKIRMYRGAGFTPAGTNQALTFTGSALAAHRHELFVATGASDSANTRLNVVTGEFSITDAAITIAGISAASGAAGGIVDVTGGTPAGTINTPTFTGTAVAATNLIELVSGSTAVVAATLYMEVVGW